VERIRQHDAFMRMREAQNNHQHIRS
jgi:hypothetical protein